MKNKMGHIMVLAFLVSISGRLSASLGALVGTDVNSTKITLNPVDLYIKKNISGAGTITPLLDSNTRKLRGVVSFDANGRLSQNRAVVFDKIFIGYQTDAAESKEGNLVYNKQAIAALYNADIVISQDGREVLRKNISSLTNINDGENIMDGYGMLDNLRYLVDDQDVLINLEFAPGVTMPEAADGGNQYIFVKLSGLETQRKEVN